MATGKPLTVTSKKIMNNTQVCKSCGVLGAGNYCSQCGQPYKIKRITLSALVHDVFHFFTHLEKGFGYTLKQLIIAPGKMQRAYIEGERTRHQKPFSMFFICATITAVSRYWIYETLLKYYNEGSISEANFFHQYMVILYIFLFPSLKCLYLSRNITAKPYGYLRILRYVCKSLLFFYKLHVYEPTTAIVRATRKKKKDGSFAIKLIVFY